MDNNQKDINGKGRERLPKNVSEQNQTEISELGEFGLISYLTRDFPLKMPKQKGWATMPPF